MKCLASLTAAVAIGTSLIAATPATAGFTTKSTKGYDAWCAEIGNNCKVSFQGVDSNLAALKAYFAIISYFCTPSVISFSAFCCGFT